MSALPANDPIDEITSLDDLRRLAEAVRTEQKPRLVAIAGGGEITLAPAKKKRRKMTPEERAKADDEAFMSSAGALEGLFDPEEFKKQYRAARGQRGRTFEFEWPDE